MEQRQLKNRCRLMVMAILALTFAMIPCSINAQTQKHSRERYLQLRSMETGIEWNFHPGAYYVTMHKRYSGGRNLLHPKFNMAKSNVGPLAPRRLAEVELEKNVSKKLDQQIAKTDSIAIEETARTGERTIDLVYSRYKSSFELMKSNINECLDSKEIIMDDEMLHRSIPLREQLDVLDEEIKYIHKTGLTNQLEQGKRDIAYNDIKERLEKLSNKSYNLLLLAKAYYKIYH